MHPPPIGLREVLGPLVGAGIFVALMSLVREPARRTLNAVLVAGAAGVYLSGGFGLAELLFPAVITPVAYRGIDSYRFTAFAWLMHSGWDLAHHLWGHQIWPFMATSSFGCMVFDAAIAVWFLANAPGIGRIAR